MLEVALGFHHGMKVVEGILRVDGESDKEVEKKEVETKLNELKGVMDAENLQKTETKLLIFMESKDILEYLVEKLKKWGYSVTFIHGGLNLDQRIRAENEFRNQAQIMVSTEAGGEGINLQFCWIMVNYDIPWNPNRLEQRMGRVHRYGQQHDVHIYNLVAVDTREGRILERLFDKLSHIRDHLGSDRIFDVVGEVLVGKNLKDLIVFHLQRVRIMPHKELTNTDRNMHRKLLQVPLRIKILVAHADLEPEHPTSSHPNVWRCCPNVKCGEVCYKLSRNISQMFVLFLLISNGRTHFLDHLFRNLFYVVRSLSMFGCLL
jgi:copper chaperone CopZ